MVKNEILQSVDGLTASQQKAMKSFRYPMKITSRQSFSVVILASGIGNQKGRELATKKRHQ